METGIFKVKVIKNVDMLKSFIVPSENGDLAILKVRRMEATRQSMGIPPLLAKGCLLVASPYNFNEEYIGTGG